MGAFVVVTGAVCMCGAGTAPFNLVATNNPTLMTDGKTTMVSADCVLGQNVIQTPGCMCSSLANPAVATATAAAQGALTPQPCTPVITSWVTPDGKVLTKGGVVINSQCSLACAYCTMSITNPGQNKILA